MAMINPYILANRGGIPRLEATGISVNGTTSVDITFAPHRFLGAPYIGLLLIKIPQNLPTTGTTLPIRFVTSGEAKALTYLGGSAVTLANLGGKGMLLCAYDSVDGVLQLLTGYVESAS